MTTKEQTRKALNEIVTPLVLGGIGAYLGANMFLRSGQQKGTGFRYRVGERIKQVFDQPVTNAISKNIATPWAEAIIQGDQEKAHQDLADAFGIKTTELYRHLQSHARVIAASGGRRDQLRQLHAAAQKRKQELTLNLFRLHDDKTQAEQELIRLKNTHPSGHPNIIDMEKKLRFINHDIHANKITSDNVPVLDSMGMPTGAVAPNHNIKLNPADITSPKISKILSSVTNDFIDAHGMTVPNPEKNNANYTNADIISNTGFENLLASNPSAARQFQSMKKHILEPSQDRAEKLIQYATRNPQQDRADREKRIQDDLANQKAYFASNPRKSITQSGISAGERVKRALTALGRNAIIDKLRTSL